MNKALVTRPTAVQPLAMSQLFQSSISTMPAPFIDIEFGFSEFSDTEDIPDTNGNKIGNRNGNRNRNRKGKQSILSHVSIDSQVYSDSSESENKNESVCGDTDWVNRKEKQRDLNRISSVSLNDIIEARHQSHIDSYMNEMQFGIGIVTNNKKNKRNNNNNNNNNKHSKDISEFTNEIVFSNMDDELNSSKNDETENENVNLSLSKTNTDNTDNTQNTQNSTNTLSSQNTNSTTNEELIEALPSILDKFDVLFPFYRLSDKDCKQLSLFVLNEINSIDKIFCNAKGRSLEAIIYYYDSTVPKKISFYNNDDSENEVSQWKDIKMTSKYCQKYLTSS